MVPILFLWNIILGARQRGATRRSSRAPSGQVHIPVVYPPKKIGAQIPGVYPIVSHIGGLSDFFDLPGFYRIFSTYRGLSDFFPHTGGLSDPPLKIRGFVEDKPNFVAPSFGPALMTRGCFGALRLAAARLSLLHACTRVFTTRVFGHSAISPFLGRLQVCTKHSFLLSLSLILSQSVSFSYVKKYRPLYTTHTHTHARSLSLSLCLSNRLSLAQRVSLSNEKIQTSAYHHTHTHILTLALFLSYNSSLCHTWKYRPEYFTAHMRSLSLSLTHTHTLRLSFSHICISFKDVSLSGVSLSHAYRVAKTHRIL